MIPLVLNVITRKPVITKYNTPKDEVNSELTFESTMRKWILRVKAGGDKCIFSVPDSK